MLLFAYDSHCHLEHIQAQLHHSLIRLIAAASLAEVDALVTLRNSYPVYKIGFGVHPWYIQSIRDTEELIKYLTRIIEVNNLPDFIGEIGLDRYKPDFSGQIKFFEAQLAIAKQYNLPVVIHCVKAYNEVLSILKKHKIQKGIIHGFNANAITAKQFCEAGFLLGIGSHITRLSHMTEAIKDISLKHIALESDAPFMPAFNKKTSSSSDCFLYAQMLARLKNSNLIDVINQSNQNIIQLNL